MKDLEYWKNNCEEDYVKTPMSVLRYISELEKEKKQPLWIGAELQLDDNTVKVLIGIDQEDGNSLEYTTTADIDYHKNWGRKNETPWTSSKEDLVVSRNSNEVIFDKEHNLKK
jgi:hypothetical protein